MAAPKNPHGKAAPNVAGPTWHERERAAQHLGRAKGRAAKAAADRRRAAAPGMEEPPPTLDEFEAEELRRARRSGR
jgi:hypothetical protein